VNKAVFGIAAVIGIAIVIVASIPQQEQEPAGRNLEVKIEDAASSKSTPAPVERLVTEPLQQQVPAPGFEDVPEMIVETENSCDTSYPDVCIDTWPPDLDCDEIGYSNFRVIGDDPHGFDRDNDGIGCEVGSPQSSNPVETTPSCDPSYPDVCIAPYPPDLNCGDIGYSNFRVIGDDPHGFDRDNDGIGCES